MGFISLSDAVTDGSWHASELTEPSFGALNNNNHVSVPFGVMTAHGQRAAVAPPVPKTAKANAKRRAKAAKLRVKAAKIRKKMHRCEKKVAAYQRRSADLEKRAGSLLGQIRE